MGLESENQEELKPKPSNQKLVSGSVGKGDESKIVLAVCLGVLVTPLHSSLSKMLRIESSC